MLFILDSPTLRFDGPTSGQFGIVFLTVCNLGVFRKKKFKNLLRFFIKELLNNLKYCRTVFGILYREMLRRF